MHRYAFLIAACIFAFARCAAGAQGEGTIFPDGLWLPKKKDVAVRIEKCGKLLCGYISWMRQDVEKMTPEGKPMCNLKVLWDFHQDTRHPNTWNGGKIYKADKGEVYSGSIKVLGMDELEMRGFLWVPVLGKSYVLKRAQESQYPPCSRS